MAHERVERHAGGDGNEADEEANERVGANGLRLRLRREERDDDLVLPDEPCVRDERNDVRLALDPRVRDGDGGGVEWAKRGVAVDLVAPERVVDHDLRDGDGRVGGVADVELDDAFPERHAIEGEVLRCGRAVVEPAGGIGRNKTDDQDRKQREGDDEPSPADDRHRHVVRDEHGAEHSPERHECCVTLTFFVGCTS